MHSEIYDVIISGAGPAGCSTSMFLSKAGIKHLIIDKSSFPRDKICGDALSGKVKNILNELNPVYYDELIQDSEGFMPSKGVIFGSPNGKILSIPFKKNINSQSKAPGFISKRIHFDQYLFSKLDPNFAQILTQTELTDCIQNEQYISLSIVQNNNKLELKTKLLIAADGVRSIAAKKLSKIEIEPQHYSAAVRAYYDNVKDLNKDGYIEIHFLKEALPGYFWIFPLPNNQANIGLGMLTKDVKKHKIDLKKKLVEIVEHHPLFKNRFNESTMIQKIGGWGLPLGSKKKILSGNRYMLTGDAASIIDPFTGEGIANAMISGKIAAQMAIKALHENKFDEAFLKSYDSILYNKIWSELKLSHQIQKLIKYPWLFNFVVNRANKSKSMKDLMISMFDDIDLRKQLKSPKFFLNLILGR